MYVSEFEIGSEIMDEHFYSLTELPNDYYEAEKTKTRINLDLPIHLGVFILNYAKLRMLQFYYDFLDYYLPREDFHMLEMDTDSNYLGITAESVEDLIKPELKEQFDRDRHNWFVTPLAPQGKRTPGLFKVEFKGDKMIGLCIKSYCTELFVTENSPAQVKFSMKGVNKGQFKSPMPHYEHVLTTKQNFRACDQGICAKDESMVTYKQYKNALTYFYPKRKVLADGCTDCTLWTFENYVHSQNTCSLYERLTRHAHRLCLQKKKRQRL